MKKLFCILDVLLFIWLKYLPEGRSENMWWLGCDGSVIDFLSTLPSCGAVQIQQGGQLYTDGLFCRPDDALQFLNVMFDGWAVPDGDGGVHDRLYDGCVELHHQLLKQVEQLQWVQEVRPLLGSLSDEADPTSSSWWLMFSRPWRLHSHHGSAEVLAWLGNVSFNLPTSPLFSACSAPGCCDCYRRALDQPCICKET